MHVAVNGQNIGDFMEKQKSHLEYECNFSLQGHGKRQNILFTTFASSKAIAKNIEGGCLAILACILLTSCIIYKMSKARY